MHSAQKVVDCLTQAFWAVFFVLFGCWLAAESIANGSLLLTTIALFAFILLVTAVRYFASVCLNRILHNSAKEASAELWFPKRKIRFLLLMCVAVVLLYLISEVTPDWASTLLGVTTMLVLYFAQTKPDFQPFRWWALVILPLAALTSSAVGVSLRDRAPITSISFGVALFCSSVVLLFLHRTNSAGASCHNQ